MAQITKIINNISFYLLFGSIFILGLISGIGLIIILIDAIQKIIT